MEGTGIPVLQLPPPDPVQTPVTHLYPPAHSPRAAPTSPTIHLCPALSSQGGFELSLWNQGPLSLTWMEPKEQSKRKQPMRLRKALGNHPLS